MASQRQLVMTTLTVHFDRELRRLDPEDAAAWRAWLTQHQLDYMLIACPSVLTYREPTKRGVGEWLKMHEAAKNLAERAGTDGEFETPPRTTMAGDDACLGAYHLTTAFRMCIGAAIDHLYVLTSLIVDLGRLNPSAPYSVARGILENAAASFWLIHPRSRDERIERTLQWWAQNARDQHKATVGGGTTNDEIVARVKELATARGLDPDRATSWPSSTDMVKYADIEARTLERIPVLLPWQICSGFAHGRGWAQMGMLQTETVREVRPAVQQMRLTNSVDRMLSVAQPRFHLLATTLGRRCRDEWVLRSVPLGK